MSDPVIVAENISKAYHLGQIGSGTLTNDLKAWWAKARGKPNPLMKIGEEELDGETLWALRDVSFLVDKGTVLGIIGRNGAGKSTLLKILSRVTAPTAGQIKVKGRIASLLEVGTGFHPELTGRRIYLNGAILGMKKVEVDRKFDEILDFSEVEQFIDTPVKRYSSGMYVRLAFAVAAHLEPEILVVDEVLAVGDAEFQKKSLGKMGDVARDEGRTVLFVSHNMSSILRLTQESIVLEKGHLALPRSVRGSSGLLLIRGECRSWRADLGCRGDSPRRSPIPADRFATFGQDQEDRDSVRSTEAFQIEMEYALAAPLTGLRIGIYISTARGEYVLTSFDTDDQKRFEKHGSRPAGHYISSCTLPPDFLNGGRYTLGVNASSYRVRRYFMDEQALTFNVDTSGAPGKQWAEPRPGVLRPRLEWKIETR